MSESGTPAERSPLYSAQHELRYQRQSLIQSYEAARKCRLVVLMGQIVPFSLTLFEEVLTDIHAVEDLHVLLHSYGGDGEIAVRMARAAQARCKSLSVIVPDVAKSAGTLFTLAATHIIMGPTSDLGPTDPQIMVKPNAPFVAAKDIIKSVEDAAAAVETQPNTYALYSALLSDVSALLLQQARAAIAQGSDLLKQALASNMNRSKEQVEKLSGILHPLLLDQPHSHGAIFGAKEATNASLPVVTLEPDSEQWKAIWALWTRYFHLSGGATKPMFIFEGARLSQIVGG